MSTNFKKKIKLMKIKNKRKGILFWVTGLSGSGKSAISRKIAPYIKKNFGKTVILSGDDLRHIFNLNKYDFKSRIKYLKFYHKFCKRITDQKINLIFSVVGLSHNIRNLNKKKIDNYVEIYIRTNLKKIKKRKMKRLYIAKSKNIWGIDIKPEFPKKPTIVVNNNFSKNTTQISNLLVKKIERIFF